jgi:outer membrane protein assembly factor BamA
VPGRILAASLALWLAGAALAQTDALPALGETPTLAATPTLAELEARGARIGEIIVDAQDIFDLDDPRENNMLFRAANALHIRTRPDVVRRALLFKPGDPLSVRVIEETERLLRDNPYLYDVAIRPVQVHEDGVVDLEVVTRDTWSLKPDVSYGREGGVDTGSISIEERNLLGTGISVSIGRVKEIDYSGTEFTVSDRHAFGGWTQVNYAYSDLDTGHRNALSVAQPFYALDTKEAAGVSAFDGDRIASDYRAGEIVSQYHHSRRSFDVFAGRSAGLQDSWVQRFSAGYNYESNEYELDPTREPPEQLPENHDLSGPYFRYELIQDDVRRVRNFDQIERPEFFDLGFRAALQIGRALESLGATRDSWIYKLALSDGTTGSRGQVLLANAAISGRYDELESRRQLSAEARYYVPRGSTSLFYASVSGAVAKSPDIYDVLQIGGDSGLRGYPLRYQTGDRRFLATLEQRIYTDYFPFRLFRVGGAVFFDVGRAWGGDFDPGDAEQGWLADFGFGLRILSARSAFGNVIHIDVAFPAVTGPNIDAAQLVIKSRTSF